MNHGAGFQKASQNTTEMVEKWIDEYQQKHEEKLTFKQAIFQQTLFGEWEVVAGVSQT
jgi:predicted RNase H-like HicB family nuclease